MFYRADSSRGDGMIINTYLMLWPLTAQHSHRISPHYFPSSRTPTIVYSHQFCGSTEKVSNPILFASELFLKCNSQQSEVWACAYQSCIRCQWKFLQLIESLLEILPALQQVNVVFFCFFLLSASPTPNSLSIGLRATVKPGIRITVEGQWGEIAFMLHWHAHTQGALCMIAPSMPPDREFILTCWRRPAWCCSHIISKCHSVV